jgi:hypothetical protein
MEFVQTGCDCVTARDGYWYDFVKKSNALCDTFNSQLKSGGGIIGSKHNDYVAMKSLP